MDIIYATSFPMIHLFQQAARNWAVEEIQHGEALGRYAELADPTFSLATAYARFEQGYGFDINAVESVRGSRSGELIARCIVETGTSSYYTAIADATEEPVCRQICRQIAADELRHYKLFYTHLKRYLSREELSRFERMRIVLGRMRESEDDELAFAYYAANAPADAIYRREKYARSYMMRAYRFYQPVHMDRVVAMAFKVCGSAAAFGLARDGKPGRLVGRQPAGPGRREGGGLIRGSGPHIVLRPHRRSFAYLIGRCRTRQLTWVKAADRCFTKFVPVLGVEQNMPGPNMHFPYHAGFFCEAQAPLPAVLLCSPKRAPPRRQTMRPLSWARVPCRYTHSQWPGLRFACGTMHDARRGAARPPRPDRNQDRLRPRRLFGLHGLA